MSLRLIQLMFETSKSSAWHSETSSSATAERPRDACSTSCCTN